MQTTKQFHFFPIGLMLFALFFGAGNLIFPASMGQAAGYNVWWAVLGFCITGVGLPLIAIIAVAYSGSHTIREITSRVHPYYGFFFTVVCYLSIGPCFAVPRTGTVSYEIAVVPFLDSANNEYALPIFLAIFFAVAGCLAAYPSKLVSLIGKFLTPALVLTLAIFIIKSFITPIGDPVAPQAAYATPSKAMIQGILDGYNTLDAIAALIFASLVINAVISYGYTDNKVISKEASKSAFVAGPMLAIIYIFIAKIGADGVNTVGMQETGAPILAETAKVLFGNGGALLLSIIVLLACLTTCIGLISCCSLFITEICRRISYKTLVVIFTVVSYFIGLFGLKTIIVSTIPVLMFLYPLCIVIVSLMFLDKFFGSSRCVYAWTVGVTFIMATINGLETAKIALGGLNAILQNYVPLHSLGLGWIPFAVVGFAIGLIHKHALGAKKKIVTKTV